MSKVTYNKDGSVRKNGSGRKKGAKSFINITLTDLQMFCGSAAVIPVSRVWLEQMGAAIADAPTTVVTPAPAPVEEEQKISFVLHQ
jgi:hypothetical protein